MTGDDEEARVTTAAQLMRDAAARLRDPYRCNSDPIIDATLADWLDSAAQEATEVGPDYRAERVAAAVLGREVAPLPSRARGLDGVDPAAADAGIPVRHIGRTTT